MANLSTLASTTCFRTADGEFHGFEGVNDNARLLPRQLHARLELRDVHGAPVSVALRDRCARRLSATRLDDAGAMHFRQCCPTGKPRSGFAAADGQMGQIMHAYLDWPLSGDDGWLKDLAADQERRSNLRGCRADGTPTRRRDGRRAAQHLRRGVLRAESDVRRLLPGRAARVRGDGACRGRRSTRPRSTAASSTNGSNWIDAQSVQRRVLHPEDPRRAEDQIARRCAAPWGRTTPSTRSTRWASGCLVDQLVGQYLAEVAGLGAWSDPAQISARRSNRSTATTTSARWPGTTRCSGPMP